MHTCVCANTSVVSNDVLVLSTISNLISHCRRYCVCACVCACVRACVRVCVWHARTHPPTHTHAHTHVIQGMFSTYIDMTCVHALNITMYPYALRIYRICRKSANDPPDMHDTLAHARACARAEACSSPNLMPVRSRADWLRFFSPCVSPAARRRCHAFGGPLRFDTGGNVHARVQHLG